MTIVSTGDRAAAWPLVHFPSPLQPFAQLLLPGRHWVLEDLMGTLGRGCFSPFASLCPAVLFNGLLPESE